MVGKRLVHRLWYRFLSWLISNTFSHSFSVIRLLMLSAVCSSSRSSFPPNYTESFSYGTFGASPAVFVRVGRALTLGLVGATLQARKASRYDNSLTPRAFSPLRPSAS